MFASLKGLLNKNFNCLIFSSKEIIYTLDSKTFFCKNNGIKFLRGRMQMYSEPSQTFKTELFVEIVNDF